MYLNDNVREILEGNMWSVATLGDTINVVPIHYKHVTEDGNLVVVDNFLRKTKENVLKTGVAAVSAFKPGVAGYQVKGKATYITEGELFEKCAAMFDIDVKGIVYITADEIYYTTPGPNAGLAVEE